MKTMNKIITLLLIVGLTGLFSRNAVAQLNDQFKKQAEQQKEQKQPENKLEEMKEEAAPTPKKTPAKTVEVVEEVEVPDPVFTPQVFTYNHATAEQARETQLMKKGELKATVNSGEAKIKEARDKIAATKDALEKAKAAKKIKETEYLKKMNKIMKAEKWVNDLELSVQKGKELTAE